MLTILLHTTFYMVGMLFGRDEPLPQLGRSALAFRLVFCISLSVLWNISKLLHAVCFCRLYHWTTKPWPSTASWERSSPKAWQPRSCHEHMPNSLQVRVKAFMFWVCRLHTIIDCDMVLVMDNGLAAEWGRPATLLDNPNGTFTSMPPPLFLPPCPLSLPPPSCLCPWFGDSRFSWLHMVLVSR